MPQWQIKVSAQAATFLYPTASTPTENGNPVQDPEAPATASSSRACSQSPRATRNNKDTDNFSVNLRIQQTSSYEDSISA